MPPVPFRRRLLIEELEPRLLFSADLAPALADSSIIQSEERLIGANGEFTDTANSAQQAQHARLEVVFIDLRVQDYAKILADIQAQNADGHSIEVVLIDPERDGIAQIGALLAQRGNIDAVHLISHGSAGSVQLGSGELNFDTLLTNAAAIKQWGNALTADADILIYGCDLASTEAGQSLVSALGKLTGADVAASDDKTGSAVGADWVFEYRIGKIQTESLLGVVATTTWQGALAVAPVLDSSKSPMLAAQNEDAGTPVGAVGTLVSTLVDFAVPAGQVDNVSDPDVGALLGVAVTAADTSNGTWYYSTDSGTNWSTLGTVSESGARLLAADASTRLYFQSNANWNGTLANAITFRVWDQTSGSNGGTANIASAPATVRDQIDAISYSGNNGTASWVTNWTEIGESDGAAAGFLQAAVYAGMSTNTLQMDTDNLNWGLSRGVNLGGATSATLSFDYMRRGPGGALGAVSVQAYNGTSWTTLQTFNANVMDAASTPYSVDISAYANTNSAIRFVVTSADTSGRMYFDNVQVAYNAPATGGTTAFSSATDTASLTVNPVNDAPSISIPISINALSGLPFVFSLANGTQINLSDIDAGSNPMQMTLSVGTGTLTLSQTSGLSFTTGTGSNDASMTFTGTMANINAALEGMSYTSPVGMNGNALLSVSASDLGNTGTGGALSDAEAIAVYVGDSVFLQGNYLEVGIDGRGTLGSTTPAPTGYLSAGQLLGAESDPERDGWVSYDGDFITPGSPLDEWGVQIGGLAYANSNSSSGVGGALIPASDNGQVESTAWDGTAAGLNIRQTFSVARNDLYLDSFVTLTNASGAAMTDVYFYRHVDPDNNVDQGGTHETTNTVLSQGDNGSGIALVSATQADGSYMALMGFGGNARVAYGNFGSVSPADAWSGLGGHSVSGSAFQDQGITLVYKISSLAVGESVTLNLRYLFAEEATPYIDLDINNSTATGTAYSGNYVENGAPVPIVDSDAVVSDSNSPSLTQLVVTLTNALNGASEILSAVTTGTSITANYVGGVLTLSGNDTLAHYTQVLRSLTYQNTSENPNTTPRVITLVASDGVNSSNVATATLAVTAINDAPVFTGLSGTTAYVEGNGGVVLDGDVTVFDAELNSADSYDGATLTLARNGGGHPDDALAFDGTVVTTSGANIFVSGVQVGTFTFTGGELVVSFSADATQARVNTLMQNIVYWNWSVTPPPSVQINWTFNDGNSGTQGSGGALVANGLTTVNITAVNSAPVISMPNGGQTYTENGTPVLFDAAPTITDVDSANFDGGTLTASIPSNASADDRITIRNQGVGAGQIGTSGFDVTYSGAVIGSWSGGTSGFAPLVVTLNASATQAVVQALAGNIQFSNVSENPSTAARLIRIVVSDGDGGTSNNGQNLLNVAAVNDAPVITTVAPETTYVEGGSPQVIDALGLVSDVDSANFDSGILTVSITQNASADDRLQVGNFGTGAGQVGVSGFDVTYGGVVIGSWSGGTNGGDPLAIAFNVNASLAAVQEVRASIQFLNVSEAPSAAAREIRFALTDGDGGTATPQAKLVHVVAVNDAPSGTNGAISVTEDVDYVFSLADFGFTDIDGNSLERVWFTTLPGQGTLKWSGATFAAGNFVSASDIALGLLTYTPPANASGNAYTSFTFQLQDNGGTANGGVDLDSTPNTVTVNVAPVNDAPVAADDRLSAHFDGLDDYIVVPGSASLVMNSFMTMEAWINPDVSGNAVQLLLNKEGEYEMSIFADGSLNFAFAEGGAWAWHDTGVDIARNTWTHIAMTYDAGVVTTYINGALANTQTLATPVIDDVYPAMNELRIGGRTNSPDGQYFDGRIAEVRVWNVVRSQAEIAGAMNASLTGGETGLAACWSLDENNGVTATDKTANANHGALTNGAGWSGYRVNEDLSLNVAAPGAQANDYDPDGDPLTAILVSGPAHGSLILNADGSFSYTPDADWHGTDSFGYKVNDGTTDSNTATVFIRVDPVNDAPASSPVTLASIAEDSGARLITQAELLSNANDKDGDALTATSLTLTSGSGTLTGNGNGTWTYTPSLNDDTSAAFSYIVTDGNLTASGSATLDITTVNDAPADLSLSANTVAENAANGTAVGTVTGTDPDSGDTRAYSLTDSAGGRFAINNSTGQITVANGGLLNYEAATSHNVIVRVTDSGGLTYDETFTINVTNVNEAPAGTDASLTINEDAAHTFTTTNFGFSDVDAGDSLSAVRLDTLPGAGSLTLNGSAVAAGQIITVADITAGNLVFTPAAEANGTSYASFTFSVRDSNNAFDAAPNILTFNVTPVNDAPLITSNGGGGSASISVAEDTSAVTTVAATDIDLPAQTLSYTISGADAAQFVIDANTGVLSFLAAPDYDNPTDSGGNNIYNVTVQVTDGNGGVDTQAIAVTVTNRNDAPVATITPTDYFATEQVALTLDGTGLSISDIDAGGASVQATLSVASGTLSASAGFTGVGISGSGTATLTLTGSVSAINNLLSGSLFSSLSYTADSDAPPVTAMLTLSVDDLGNSGAGGAQTGTDTATIHIAPVNDAPQAANVSASGVEDATSIAVTLSATDIDGSIASFRLTSLPANGTLYLDAGLTTPAATLTAYAATGNALTLYFKPDANWNGSTSFNYTALDNGGMADASAALATLTVTAVNDEQFIAVNTGTSVAENSTGTVITAAMLTTGDVDHAAAQRVYTLTATPLNGTLRLSGAALAFNDSFTQADIDGGLLRYDHNGSETASDSFGFSVDDGVGSASTASFNLTITPVNDNAPVIGSNGAGANAAISVMENTTAVTTVTATDADLPAQTLTYAIVGGADAALFAIDANTGALSFLAAPDRESAADSGSNHIYDVNVQVSDGNGGTDTQAIAVTVTDIDEFNVGAITDTNSATNQVNENAAIGTIVGITAFASDADATTNAITYSLSNNDGGRFAIDSATGVVTVAGAINREADGAARSITVRATSADGSFTDQAFGISINDVDEFDVVPLVDINAAINAVAENAAFGTVVGVTAFASDADATTNVITYSLSDTAGGRFAIDAATGMVTVANGTLLDYETATSHSITLRADSSDGSSTTLILSIAITPVNDNAPAITSDGGGATTTLNVAENATTVTTVTASDADLPAQTLAYAIVGGADAALFTINGSTGALSFAVPPDFEVPADSGSDNVYDVIVQVTDGLFTDAQTVSVTVTPVNDNTPVTTPVTLAPIAEDSGARLITQAALLANASDADGDSLSAADLAISSGSGTLTDNGNGTWTYTPALNDVSAVNFTYTITDGNLSAVGVASLDITPVNDAPTFTPINLGNLNEDTPRLITQADLLAGTADADGDTLSAINLALTAGSGTLIDHGNGSWTFTPATDWNGGVAFSFEIGDGTLQLANSATLIVDPVNDAPTLLVNTLSLLEGEAVILNSTHLNASDAEQSASQRFYTVSNVAYGQFEWVAAPGTAISSFTQADIDASRVVFVHDASDVAPTYDVSVSDGALATSPQAAAINFTAVSEGINVSAASGASTTEAGGSASFDVTLNSQPFADVTFFIASGNPAEGTASLASLTFTAANWNVAQQVTVTGVNDAIDDGDQAYTVQLQAAVSADRNYHALDANDVALSNLDDDTVGILVTPTSGLVTDESGASDTFSVVLTAQPLADVIISLDSSNPAEGVLSIRSLTFTAADWNIPQVVTVSGVDDTLNDGGVAYQILTAPAASADPLYNGMAGGVIDITNLDRVDPVLIPDDPVTEPEPVTLPADPTPVPKTPEPSPEHEAAPDVPGGRLLTTSDTEAADNRDDRIDVVLNKRLMANAPRLAHDESPHREVLTNSLTQGGLLLHLLDIIQAEYTLDGSDGNSVAPAIQVNISQNADFQVEVLSQGTRITAVSLSVGAVWWALRAGGLFAGLLTSLPAWRSFDVLPVLNRDGEEDEDAWSLGDEPPDDNANTGKNATSLPV